jgi:hypothetical protein
MADLKNTSFTGTATLRLPVGTTAQRPGSPANGYTRFNTTTGVPEIYDGGAWKRFDSLVEMTTTGAVYTADIYDNDVPYKVHVFTGNGTFTPTYAGEIEYLVVAGGGGGGGIISGGGGAGGLLTGKTVVTNQQYTVTVGNGGVGGLGWNNNPQYGAVGQNSSISNIATATGGGGGGGHSVNQTGENENGGSGGGGAADDFGTGIAGQGYNGGAGDGDTGGGGGGAGEPGDTSTGATATVNSDGKGGNGKSLTITGWPRFYAGGGGQGVREGGSRVAGRGGLGGGGTGTVQTVKAADGVPNTGGGGGGGGYNASSTANIGGTGGSGIVVVRYKRQAGTLGPQKIYTRNLAAHFDAGDLRSYNWADSSVNNIPGNVWYNIAGPYGSTNITLQVMGTPQLRGSHGGYFQMDGSAAKYMQGDLSSITGEKITIEMWCKRDTSSETEYYWDNRNTSGGTWMLSEYDGFDYNWGNVVRYNDSNSFTQWHQHVAVKDGTESRLYRNGVLRATGGEIGQPVLSSDFHLGTRFTTSAPWNGPIAILRIYGEALGDAAIKQNFEAERGRFGI